MTATEAKDRQSMRRRMLVFDSAYTYEIMIQRNFTASVTGRDCNGWFDHIWTVHPVATLLKPEGSKERFGLPIVRDLAPGHTLIEGRIGRYAALAWFPILNFLIAQFGLVRMLLRLVDREGIAIVRAEDPLYNGLLSLVIARLRRIPLMVGVWGNPAAIRKVTGAPLMPRLFRKVWVEEKVERLVLRRADLAMAQNENNRRFITDQGVPREKTGLFRFSNVLDPVHFKKPGLRDDGRAELESLGVGGRDSLMCISRLQELKLVDHVVRAVRTLQDRDRDVVALFVGDGPYRDGLAALASELGVADRVILCGDREQPWLARVIPAMSAVICPLAGRALGEAALGGAPIVAYDNDWHSEIIVDGETGELVPYLDHVAIADAVERLLDDPERARRLGDAVRERAMEMLDPAICDRIQISAYESLMAR